MQLSENQPYRFQDQRQERIYRRLRLIGEGPAIFFRDACKMMDLPASLGSTTHLVGHLMRETESAIRDVLKPQVPHEGNPGRSKGHIREIRLILDVLNIPEDHPVSQLWLSLPGDEGLQSRAHRDALFTPRPADEDFLALWNSLQTILDFVLDKFEQNYLDYHKILDELGACLGNGYLELVVGKLEVA